MSERLDRTREMPTVPLRSGPPKQREPDFQPGKASVPPKRPDPTLSMEPGRPDIRGQVKRPVESRRERWRKLRRGGGWTAVGSMVLLISWGLWASDGGGDVISEAISLGLIFVVALGLFFVCRLVGGVVLEKLMSRTRRGAVLSHMTIGLFLAVVGIKLASQVSWIITAVNYLRGVR